MPDLRENQTYWNASAGDTAFPSLSGDLSVDVAIIGGGIVGVTTARMLKSRGVTVALVEGRKVGQQVTGKSTAKVTSQHGLLYHTLAHKFGEPRARLYADAQQWAVREIRALAEQYGIDCDLETTAAYAYTLDPRQVDKIEQEVAMTQRLGLPATLVRETGLPFEVLAAIRYDDQAQFHPTRYVAGLAQTIPGDGSHVFEHSRALDWEPTRVTTEHGSVTARHVVMATHLPLGQVGGYYARAYPHAEPVIAAKVGYRGEGMYINVERPSHSFRIHRRADGEVYGIVAGTDFRPGHTEDERKHFDEIERWLRENFEAGPVEYRWVNEDYAAMDSAPFIGWSAPGKGYLVATGFAAWGITNGTVAGRILADLATDTHNDWLELFDAGRVKPLAGGAKFVLENASVGAHLVSGYLSRKLRSFDELPRGEAAIMKIDARNVAAYRDDQGVIHSVSAVCSHMGCLVGWNETDRTWDCPCHGSRFALDGSVIHGPATKPLGAGISG